MLFDHSIYSNEKNNEYKEKESMSKDASAYTIKRTTFKENDIINDFELGYDGYVYDSFDKAPEFLVKMGQKVIIRYNLTDFNKACFENFNSKYDCMQYHEDGYTFFYKGTKLGFITNEEIEKYCYTEDRLSYIMAIEKICDFDNCYRLELETGLYSFNEILNECLRIIEDDESELEHELIYNLVKTLKYARKEEKIYFFVD